MGFTPSPPADITVKDGDKLEIGEVSLKVIHTPGHSASSVSILLDNGEALIGDLVRDEGGGESDDGKGDEG